MKSSRFAFQILTASLIVGGLAALPLAHGAGATNPAPTAKGKTAPATNNANAILPIPPSVFDVTANPLKNPFFPNSQRHPVSQAASTNAAPLISASSFQLMGLSGSIESRLAMINHRTFGVGEAVEVITTSGQKVTIRVLQIKDTSVLVRVLAPPQPDLIELSLSKRAQ